VCCSKLFEEINDLNLVVNSKKIWLKILREYAPLKYAKKVGVTFGEECKFIKPNFGTEPFLINIGDHVEITAGVKFITHDGSVWVFRKLHPGIEIFGPIKIGNNVFIGMDSIILPNITIGNNCIVGAGSVVSKNIPDNSVAVGVPARVIKTMNEFYEGIKDDCFHIRSLSVDKKRAALNSFFFDE